MIQVKFLQDIQGSVNGTTNIQYKKDSIYSVNGIEINNYLYESWLTKGVLEVYDKTADITHQKMIKDTYENKAIFNTDENKDGISNPQNIKEVEEQKKAETFTSKLTNNFHNQFNKKRK